MGFVAKTQFLCIFPALFLYSKTSFPVSLIHFLSLSLPCFYFSCPLCFPFSLTYLPFFPPSLLTIKKLKLNTHSFLINAFKLLKALILYNTLKLSNPYIFVTIRCATFDISKLDYFS